MMQRLLSSAARVATATAVRTIHAAATPVSRRPLQLWQRAIHSHALRRTATATTAAPSSGGCGSSSCACAAAAVSSSSASASASSAGAPSGGCGSGSCACAARAASSAAAASAAEPVALSPAEQQAQESLLASLQAEVSRLYALGSYEQALAECVRSVEVARSLFGEVHPSYASTLNNAALLHKVHREDFDAAAQLYERALEAYEGSVGTSHSSYLTTLNNLALVRRKQGRLDEAQQHLMAVVDTYKSMASSAKAGSPAAAASQAQASLPLASALLSLGGVMAEQGSYARAIELQRESLGLLKRRYGTEHGATATALANLSLTYKLSGALAQALELCEAALAIRSRNLPPAHPDTIVSMNNLAEILRAQGQEEKAQVVQQKILAMIEAQQNEAAEAEAQQARQQQQEQSEATWKATTQPAQNATAAEGRDR